MNPKTVCIDARMIRASGIGTYLQGLLAGLRDLAPAGYAFSLLGVPARLPEGPWSVEALMTPIYSLREQWSLPLALSKTKAALLHSPHYNMPCLAAARTVVTVHDLIHLKFPQFWPSRAARAYAHFFFHHVIPRAQAILAVSENTKRDLMDLLSIPGERITVTYPAVSHERFRHPSAAALDEFRRLALPQDYLLYVGNLKEFKNVGRLVEAYRQLRSRRRDAPPLVMAGRNFIPGFERDFLQTSGIRWIGEASPDLLPALYHHAVGFVFPSLYEGFGLPPLEAMASGTPVICSNRASLPEVVGDAALLIDPESTEDLAGAMERLIDDAALRKDLSVKGLLRAEKFSWSGMAKQTLKAYDQCFDAA